MILPCLSLHQPWAYLVAAGIKPIENRTWEIEHHGPLAFHAAQKKSKSLYRQVRNRAIDLGVDYDAIPPIDDLDYGGLICVTAGILHVRPPRAGDDGWHLDQQFGHELGPVGRLPFRPMKGYQRFFRVKLTLAERTQLENDGVLPECEHANAGCNCDYTLLCARCRVLVGVCLVHPERPELCRGCS